MLLAGQAGELVEQAGELVGHAGGLGAQTHAGELGAHRTHEAACTPGTPGHTPLSRSRVSPAARWPCSGP